MTQPTTAVEVEFLPVYVPSEYEKQNPKAFAEGVRNVMAKYETHSFVVFLSISILTCTSRSRIRSHAISILSAAIVRIDRVVFIFATSCRALAVPTADYTYDDCRVAVKAGQLGLPMTSNLMTIERLRSRLG